MEGNEKTKWLNLKEAAQHIGMSTGFLRKCVGHKQVPFTRAGGKILKFSREALDSWLMRAAVEGKSLAVNTKAAEWVEHSAALTVNRGGKATARLTRPLYRLAAYAANSVRTARVVCGRSL